MDHTGLIRRSQLTIYTRWSAVIQPTEPASQRDLRADIHPSDQSDKTSPTRTKQQRLRPMHSPTSQSLIWSSARPWVIQTPLQRIGRAYDSGPPDAKIDFSKKKNFKSFQDWMRTLITLVTSLLELHRQIVGRRCEIFASSNCASETWISTHEWHDHKTRSYNFSALRHIVRGGYAWTNTPSWESFNAGN